MIVCVQVCSKLCHSHCSQCVIDHRENGISFSAHHTHLCDCTCIPYQDRPSVQPFTNWFTCNLL